LDRALTPLVLAGGQVGVGGALGPDPHHAGDPDDPLVADVDRAVDDALDDALAVAQVEEGQVLAVLAPARHPAAQRDGLPDVVGAQLAAPVGAHAPGRGVLAAIGHSASRTLRTRATSWSRGTISCSPRPRSRTVAVPSANSWDPTMTATRAPERPAAFICDFIDRPSNARSVRSPASRSWCARSRATEPSVVSTTNTSSALAG